MGALFKVISIIIYTVLYFILCIRSACLEHNLKIMGGSVVNTTTQQTLCNHSVAIMPYNSPYWICSGSIINHRQVTTAAHYVFNRSRESIYIRAGSVTSYSGGIVKQIENIRIHPQYNSSRNDSDFDIAVLNVNSPFEFGPTIAPIRVANPSDDHIYELIGTNVSVCGYGLSEIGYYALHFIKVPLLNTSECRFDYAPEDTVTDNEICVGNQSIHQFLAD